jgi:hypothetical protein
MTCTQRAGKDKLGRCALAGSSAVCVAARVAPLGRDWRFIDAWRVLDNEMGGTTGVCDGFWDDKVAGTSDVIVQHKVVLLIESLVPWTGQSLLAIEPPMMSAALAAF